MYISPGQQRTYVLEDVSTETTASVSLQMRSGTMLTDDEANTIRYLVSRAWSGMTLDSVSITDSAGNTYNAGEDSPSDAAELQYQMQERTNNQLRNQIKNLLDPLYGADNVSVAVNSTVEVAKRYREDTTYRQPDGVEPVTLRYERELPERMRPRPEERAPYPPAPRGANPLNPPEKPRTRWGVRV